MAVTEPDAGTNTLEIETRAKRDGDEFAINGQKMWTSGADRADAMMIVTRTKSLKEAESRSDGLSLFVIDLPADGIEIETLSKVGSTTLTPARCFLTTSRFTRASCLATSTAAGATSATPSTSNGCQRRGCGRHRRTLP